MTVVTRLVTYTDLHVSATNARQLSVSARLEAVLADGRSVVLLDDRGWSTSGPSGMAELTSTEDIEETARSVVGPDEPFDGMTREEMAAGHWGYLAGILRQHGVDVPAHDLERLPHDVVLSERLRAWIG
ncbi:hypothetical protein OHA37_33940 [Streptomyces sp. NBC_00335]|uniref:hypothetical protein n=1 Tax=unclassified Streptomyces TaxID=2593676 RepID=UPI00224DDBE2|nr:MULTISPECIES: hypothetical protein [unclassified Streptomyces]MCX5408842.1 hypothetical protein [Streptomyces sp. NBC_00086]